MAGPEPNKCSSELASTPHSHEQYELSDLTRCRNVMKSIRSYRLGRDSLGLGLHTTKQLRGTRPKSFAPFRRGDSSFRFPTLCSRAEWFDHSPTYVPPKF